MRAPGSTPSTSRRSSPIPQPTSSTVLAPGAYLAARLQITRRRWNAAWLTASSRHPGALEERLALGLAELRVRPARPAPDTSVAPPPDAPPVGATELPRVEPGPYGTPGRLLHAAIARDPGFGVAVAHD